MAMDFIEEFLDPRIESRSTHLNGIQYHYLFGQPKDSPRATVFLFHGWPDLSIGWRNQIPMLLDMGFLVVAPDMIGYGQTEAPHVPPESIAFYSFKRIADDVKELAQQLGVSRVILGGHDWGGAIVYRIALWCPELVTHIFTVCTPYTAPSKTYEPLEEMVKSGKVPNFGYQLQLASGQLEEVIRSREQIRQLLNGLYGGMTSEGLPGFDVKTGVHLDRLPQLRHTKLMSKRLLDFYAEQYAKNGIHGTLNWYRNREQNFKDELRLTNTTIRVPVLFVAATKDEALPPSMSRAMDKHIPHLTRKTVNTHHWALWAKPEEVNQIIREWLEETMIQQKSHL
ncbi:MAG: hypothetical protein L6R42_003800 [Xanthoria sp. 1 TBL-2021]|nr:MAG: hypothetical protein L6R42_003800 [Xanthoria sp. 1 TBL-2021]